MKKKSTVHSRPSTVSTQQSTVNSHRSAVNPQRPAAETGNDRRSTVDGGLSTEGPSCSLTPETTALTRRNFLKLGMGALGALAALEAGGAALLYLRSHGLDGAFGALVTAGRVNDFPAGSVTEFPDERFFLVRAPEGGFLAVHTRCPHLGCSVMWVPERGEFVCPCHAAKFSLYGDHGKPPVSRALDLFAVKIKNDLVQVDTTSLSRRDAFAPDQLVHA